MTMESRRMKQSKNSLSYNGINRGELNQLPYPPDESSNIFQYTTPRPVTDVTMPWHQQRSTKSRFTRRLYNSLYYLKDSISTNRYKILSFIIKLLIASSSIGYALYQATILILSYSARPVEISLQIVNPTTAKIPAVSLCFEYKLDQVKMKDTIETRKKVTASKLTDPTVEIVINTTPGVDDLIESCEILNHLNEPVSCSQMSTVRQSITRKLKCFSWFTHGSWKSPENETRITYKIRSIRNQEWVLIKLKNLTSLQSDTIGIGIHENHVPVQPDLANPEFTEVRRTWYPDALLSKVTLTWELNNLTRLPKPYASGCIDYKKSQETVEQILLKSNDFDVGVLNFFDRSAPAISTWLTTVYASQRELIDSCIGYSYATRYNDHWPSNLLAHETKQRNFFIETAFTNNATTNIEDNKISKRILEAANDRRLCNRLFRYPECIETSHTISLRTSHYENSPDNMEIALYVPTDTQTHMVQVPKYESREIVAIISGIFSFWIGISAMEVILPILPLICTFCSNLTKKDDHVDTNVNQIPKRLPVQVNWPYNNFHGSTSTHGHDSLNKVTGNKRKVSIMQPKSMTASNKVYDVYW